MRQVTALIAQIRALLVQIRWGEIAMGQGVDAAALSEGLPSGLSDPT